MPACQRVRRSARLRANARVHSRRMDPQESTSKGQPNAPPEAPGPRMSIQWQSENALTDVLVNYLTTHPSDCRILFYSDGKKKMSPIDDGPSGRDKGDIHGVIAHLIFANHINRQSHLRKKNKSQFTATGAGIVPLDGASAQNLLEKVHADLPWYSDLDAIWHSNPSMAVKTHSSKPGVDHAGALYSLIQPRGGAGPSMHFGAAAGAGSSMSFGAPAQSSLPPSPAYPPSTQPSPNAYPLPSTHLPPSAYPPPNAHLPPTAYPPNAYPLPNPYPPNAYSPYTGNSLIDPQLLQPPAPPGTPPVHLPGLNNSPDITIHDDFGPTDDNDLHLESAGPFSAPLDSDDMMDDDAGTPESPPPQATGKKCQLLTSPSPPPDPPLPRRPPCQTVRGAVTNPKYEPFFISRFSFGYFQYPSHSCDSSSYITCCFSDWLPYSTG
ncbi:uncharacterized protein EDB91DRAFT_1285927 [Suillus paluster]|uniref:uncharacterized protein n=1 Tax=Suillus paluster TaxID=48578 RepID=UPI001B86AE52|nr:uncharacterized protein EDB91DRAFT_1285927 [Suillus paluster]KAG1753617.1 hypothetical protein EDB91DRAFT_1285927 [Suillus paluster]